MGSPSPTRSNARREIGLICIDRLEHIQLPTLPQGTIFAPYPSLALSLSFISAILPLAPLRLPPGTAKAQARTSRARCSNEMRRAHYVSFQLASGRGPCTGFEPRDATGSGS